jgi:hypothetical protein
MDPSAETPAATVADKRVFDAIVEATYEGGGQQDSQNITVGLQFLFRHFEHAKGIKNAEVSVW